MPALFTPGAASSLRIQGRASGVGEGGGGRLCAGLVVTLMKMGCSLPGTDCSLLPCSQALNVRLHLPLPRGVVR